MLASNGCSRVTIESRCTSRDCCRRSVQRNDATAAITKGARFIKVAKQDDDPNAFALAPRLKESVQTVDLGLIRSSVVDTHRQVGAGKKRVHRVAGGSATKDNANRSTRRVEQRIHNARGEATVNEKHSSHRIRAHARRHLAITSFHDVTTNHLPGAIWQIIQEPRVGNKAWFSDGHCVEMAVRSPVMQAELAFTSTKLALTIDGSDSKSIGAVVRVRLYGPCATCGQRRPDMDVRPRVISRSSASRRIVDRDRDSSRGKPVRHPKRIDGVVDKIILIIIKGNNALPQGRERFNHGDEEKAQRMTSTERRVSASASPTATPAMRQAKPPVTTTETGWTRWRWERENLPHHREQPRRLNERH